MSSTHQPGSKAGWEPKATVPLKMPHSGPALSTVNLSAVSATLNVAASPVYSSSSSPFDRGSSGHSSPYNISRTGSGASIGSHPQVAPPQQHDTPAAPSHPGNLTAAALQALSRQASLPAVAAAPSSSPGGSRTSSPHGTSTPRALPGRSNLGPSSGADAPLSLEATLQGLTISGAASPAAAAPLNFHAPPPGSLPQHPPVEVFAKFPQEQNSGNVARPAHHGRNGGAPRHGSGGGLYSPVVTSGTPYHVTTSLPASGPPGAGGYVPAGMPPPPHHQPAFFPGSPPGGYGMPVYHPHPNLHGAGVPGVAATATAGFGTPGYYPQHMGGPQQQGHGYMMPHPYYGMMPGAFPQPSPYGIFPGPPPAGMAGGRGGSGKATAAVEAAEYARQYQAMMSYMQGFGMMVSPTGSPERMSRPASQLSFRRTCSQERQDGRGRLSARPSRLSLDMSASKSENGDAHRLDPELAPLVAEDKSELQSPLLDEFKASREGGGGGGMGGRQWTLQELRGQLYPFCRDQHGSRLVQQQLETAPTEELADLFGEVRHKLLPLMVDVFGNYVVQRFLERGGPEVQAAVAEAIRGKALPLSLQMYGCRVVQKTLEVLPQEERVGICRELTEHTLRCVRDQNGNHVVQKCIECVQPSEPAREMIEIIVNKGQSLATHTFGCRLVQRVLEFCSIDELRQQVIADVLGNTLQLSHDQYGNYVVQHLVAKGPANARDAIVGQIAPQVMTLAQHKYASNVVEACLKHGSQQHRDAVIDQMIRESGARPAALTPLMRDQYGNYVVQRALEVSTRVQRASLLAAIKPHLDSLKKFTYGKHIANKAEALLAAQAAEEAAAAAIAAQQEQASPQQQEGPPLASQTALPVPVPLPKPAAMEAQQ